MDPQDRVSRGRQEGLLGSARLFEFRGALVQRSVRDVLSRYRNTNCGRKKSERTRERERRSGGNGKRRRNNGKGDAATRKRNRARGRTSQRRWPRTEQTDRRSTRGRRRDATTRPNSAHAASEQLRSSATRRWARRSPPASDAGPDTAVARAEPATAAPGTRELRRPADRRSTEGTVRRGANTENWQPQERGAAEARGRQGDPRTGDSTAPARRTRNERETGEEGATATTGASAEAAARQNRRSRPRRARTAGKREKRRKKRHA